MSEGYYRDYDLDKDEEKDIERIRGISGSHWKAGNTEIKAMARVILLQHRAIVWLLEREKRRGYYESDDDKALTSLGKAYRIDGSTFR